MDNIKEVIDDLRNIADNLDSDYRETGINTLLYYRDEILEVISKLE